MFTRDELELEISYLSKQVAIEKAKVRELQSNSRFVADFCIIAITTAMVSAGIVYTVMAIVEKFIA